MQKVSDDIKTADQIDVNQIGNLIENSNWGNPQRGRVYATDGCAPTLNTCQGGQLEPKIIVSMRGRNPENPSDRTSGIPTEQRLEPNSQGISNTLSCVQKDNMVSESESTHYRIRKLTPKECWRLMGFPDSAFETAEKVVSNSQLYKQAGNSIVVDVIYYIFVELYKVMPYLFDDLKLSSFFSGIGAFEMGLDRLYDDIKKSTFD